MRTLSHIMCLGSLLYLWNWQNGAILEAGHHSSKELGQGPILSPASQYFVGSHGDIFTAFYAPYPWAGMNKCVLKLGRGLM